MFRTFQALTAAAVLGRKGMACQLRARLTLSPQRGQNRNTAMGLFSKKLIVEDYERVILTLVNFVFKINCFES